MGKRRKIALLVGQAYEYYQASFIEGCLGELFASDYDVCVFAMYEKYQNTAAREVGETSIFKLVPFDQFDAFILMLDTLQTPGLCDSIMAEIREKVTVPVITVDKQLEDYPCIMPRHYDGIKTIVSHLIEDHGYTDIAFLTGKSWHPYSKERLKAFQDCMADHDLEIRENRIFFGDFWYTSGENLGDKLVKMRGVLPQAVACANDQMAVGLAKSLTEHGLRIPEDIAVVGYDSNDEGRFSPKPITSVTLPAKSLGTHAAAYVMALIDGQEPPQFTEPVDMYYGASCGCCNESAGTYSRLRSTWSTNLSSGSVFSPYNHMDEDLLSQSTFYGLMNTIFSYTYQIREFTSFSLCLNDDWQHYNSEESMGRTPFTDKMIHALYCGPENSGQDKIGVDDYFDREILVPELLEERDKPSVYYFTPIYFENMAYGYAAISFEEPVAHTESYRLWLRCVTRGLEYFKRQEQLRITNSMLEANLIREPLTGFFNYKGFQRNTYSLIRELKRDSDDANISVITIDIRNLSGINNEYGRNEGDSAILKIADFLRQNTEQSHIFALGNGEFFVLIQEDEDMSADKMIRSINDMILEFNGTSDKYKLQISYGTATGSPETKNDFERLVGAAINNKNIRKHSIAKIDSGTLSEEEQEEAKVVHDIIEHNRINYHFQPIVIASTGEIFAYEALMRADVTPYMPPPVVLRYAEFFNRLYDIEKATFTNVLNIIDSKGDDFAAGSKVFINSIPGHVLKDDDFAEITDKIQTDRIVVEFTEQSEIRESDMAKIKKRYEDAGLQTAVDDYGTGYSNVSNLLAYMPNYVKIDRMLLTCIQDSPQKQHFVKDIITFSHENGIMALAEGVETAEEYKTVLELGVDLVQGYFVARPSATIVKEIDEEVREQILEINRIVKAEGRKDTYVAGREARISLPVLVEEGYSKIVIPNAEVTYRDITISGAPGFDTQIYVIIEDGYQGSLVLENIGLSGTKLGNAICIGEGCDVSIHFSGENQLNNGGIRVPDTSRVVFSGDGILRINVHKLEAYGIGNALMARHGELVFDQDGTIEIKVDSAQGIGIGSGQGGVIKINRGRYLINMSGQSGVGIGSILKGTQPIVSNCDVDISNRAGRCVGIGSIDGDCDILIDKLSLNCTMHGHEGVAIGSMHGNTCIVSMNSGYITITANVNDMICVGSLASSDVRVKLTLLSLNCEFSGDNSGFIGCFEPGAKVSIARCSVSANGRSANLRDIYAEEENINISHTKCEITINDRLKSRIDN
ncbi:diguanylate cyclase (GGDEF) domain-containing protein [Ruminococcaceae bacterium YRB3002]|nr:diguanylate cyclase (GGDEF) domain-containing protein [Ruminococcaceae bacterium YRB3002]